MAMVDSGAFNDIIKGYAILALKRAEVDEKEIGKIKYAFYEVFDEYNSSDALKALL